MTREYETPVNTRLYVVGDLHGYPSGLAAMMDKIEEDMRGRDIPHVKLVFVGDYVDRGPDSKKLLDDLIALKEADLPYERIFLKGNHENGLLEFLKDPRGDRKDWLEWGGAETLASYGIKPAKKKSLLHQAEKLSEEFNKAIPDSHRAFMDALQLYYECGGFLCVHAGIKPNFPLEEQEEHDLWMIREGFLDYEGEHPWRVVHGHTITRKPEILPNRINIDTGLYKHGVLSCAVIEREEVGILQVRP